MTKVLGTKLSTLWTRINTVLVPRQATVTTTGSYHIVTLQNAVTPTPDALVSFSIPASSGGSGDANQNAFSNVKVGSSTISATSITDTLSVTAGSNISLSVNSKTLTISASITSATITSALGYTPYSATNPNGYTSNTGTVTAVKMNNTTKTASSGIVDLGTVVTNAVTSINTKTGAVTITAGNNITVSSSNNTITISAINTTYTVATASPPVIASASVTGTSTNYARQDHTHGITVTTGDNDGQIKVAGINATVKGLGSAAYTDSTEYVAKTYTDNTHYGTITYSVIDGNACWDIETYSMWNSTSKGGNSGLVLLGGPENSTAYLYAGGDMNTSPRTYNTYLYLSYNAYSLWTGDKCYIGATYNNGLTITGVVTPTLSSSAVNKEYVDNKCSIFTGATSTAAGTSGLVPTPTIAQNNSVLFGDKSWSNLGVQPEIGQNGLALYLTRTDTNGVITAVTIPAATVTTAGILSATDKTTLNKLKIQNAYSNFYSEDSNWATVSAAASSLSIGDDGRCYYIAVTNLTTTAAVQLNIPTNVVAPVFALCGSVDSTSGDSTIHTVVAAANGKINIPAVTSGSFSMIAQYATPS